MADMRSQNKGLLAVLRGQKVGWLVVSPKGRGWLHQFKPNLGLAIETR